MWPRAVRVVLAAIVLAGAGETRAVPAEHPPSVSVDAVLAAIRKVESGGDPWAIHDNATGATHRSGSEAAAVELASRLIATGHDIDMGAFQINSRQLGRAGVSLTRLFDPTVNAALARTIFTEFHTAAKALFGDNDAALQRAIGAYNAGNVRAANPRYVDRVLRALGQGAPRPIEASVGVTVPAQDPPEPEASSPWSNEIVGLLALALIVTGVPVGFVAWVLIGSLARQTVAASMRWWGSAR